MFSPDFPFSFGAQKYLADRTFGGHVAAYVSEPKSCHHVDGGGETGLPSLLYAIRPGLVVFVAPGPRGPVPNTLRGLDRVLVYVAAERTERYEVLSGAGPEAQLRSASTGEVFVALDLPRRVGSGSLILFASRADVQ